MTTKTRKTYIGKERDDESYLGDFGVRKYDYAAGNRFTSPDVLWEKYMGWSPYNYCGNNPISLLDKEGSKWNYPQDQEGQEEFGRMINELNKTQVGRDLVKIASDKNTPLVNLKFGTFGPQPDGFPKVGQGTYHYVEDRKGIKLTGYDITIDRNSKFAIPILGHELKHFVQYLTNFKYWKKVRDEDLKNNVPHDDRRVEQEPIKVQNEVQKELQNPINP